MPQGRNGESLPQFQTRAVSSFDDITDGHSQVQSHDPQLGSHDEPALDGLDPNDPAHEEPAQVGLGQDEPPLEALPPSFEDAIRDFDDSLVLIFMVIKLKKMSLRSFLFDLLESEHPYVRHQVRMFFGKGVAAELLGKWQLYCRHRENWDGHLAHAAANYASDRMQKELRGLMALKDDVPEPDKDASAVTPQQKCRRLDELEIVAEDLGITLTAEERTFFGAIAEGSGSTNSGAASQRLEKKFDKVFFRTPEFAMTQEEVKSFSFDGIHERLESMAPIFHHTLRRLTEFQTAPLGIKSLDPVHDIKSRTAIVGTLASMIMHCQSQRHNYFQRVMGIFFHASNCSKDVINTLAKAHICVSYDSALTAVGSSTGDAVSIVREAVLKNNWYIIYDNINLYMTRADNADTQINGATATIVPGKDLGIADKPYNPQATLTLDDLVPNGQAVKDAAVASRFYLVDALQRHYSTYKRISMPPIWEIWSLPIEQSVTYPIPAMEIDRPSVEGNLEILRFIIARTLVLPATYFDNENKVIAAGDQLTVSRVETVKRSVDDDVTAPISEKSDNPGSLSFYIARLKWKRVSEESSSFHAANELMRNVFDGMVLRLWQEELGIDSSETLGTLDANQDTTTMLNQVSTAAEAIRNQYLVRPEANRKSYGNANTNAALFIRDMVVYVELG
ncbi:hypothetical protein BGX30_011781 [Mortierella sp. GBA39]|nr:hypothetical protein BGX30_011781 [Mortierella sp. GBA39]